MYHYTDSGLDNIYLKNGFKRHKTLYGEGISITDTDGLHRAIGKMLIETPKPLNGAEVRFLRIQLDLSQKRLADLLGTGEQAVRRWEKYRSKAIPGPEDRLLRQLYSEYIGGDGTLRDIVQRLADLDIQPPERICMNDTDHGWEVQVA
jgi:DNA-binding transcriptional regulator YiaG